MTNALLAEAPDLDDRVEVPPPLPERFEIVNGATVETAQMSDYAVVVANRLKRVVDRYLDRQDIGQTCVEVMFHIPQPEDDGRSRRPDWAFLSYDRWPADRPLAFRGVGWDVVPDIAAEVVSPGDPADDLIAKVREYLRGGVRLVWVVYPLAGEVHAYGPGPRDLRAYLSADDLDAGDILPGFRAPVAGLFPPTDAPRPT